MYVYMNQCAYQFYFFIFFSFFIAVEAQQNSENSFSVVVFHDNTINTREIEKVIPDVVKLKHITYDVDIHFAKDEFLYLLGIKPGDTIDSPMIITGVSFLAKKNKFSTIKIKGEMCDDALVLHFSLRSFWTLKKVKIHGVFQGKNSFLTCYVMSRGDAFSQAKHNHSIMKMKELLENEGYCANEIYSRFEYDKTNKEIIVHVYIKKAQRFLCGDIAVEVVSDNADVHCDELQKNIISRLRNKLSFQKYKKETIDREALSLKGHLDRRGFLQVSLELQELKHKHARKVDLLWKITLHHKRSFVFFGNSFFSNKELLEKVLAFGRSAWMIPATLLAEEIVKTYKDKGFWHAHVVGQEEKERSFFVIQEGSRALISAVEIHNVLAFDARYIRRHCLHKILSHKYYDKEIYDNAIKQLNHFYMKSGFLSFSVTDHVFVPGASEDEYTLIVTLHEGKQSYITATTIEGYPELQDKGPFKQIQQKHKVLFNTKIVDEQRAWLVNYFQEMGCLYPRIKAQFTMHEDEVSIVWNVDPGDKIYFGKTILAGQSSLPFKRLTMFLGYTEGEMWNQEKIKQTFKRLKELDIFETISLAPDYADKTCLKPVILKIHSDDTYEIRARAGLELQHVRKYQTFNGLTYKIGGTGMMRNPLNVGDVVRLDLDFARSHREVVAKYKRPFFMKLPLFGTMQAYSISYDQPGFVGSVNDIYTLVQNGFSYTLERKTNLLEVGFRVGVEAMSTKIKDPLLQKSLIKAIDFQPQLVDKMVPFFLMEPTIMFEYMDNALNPTSGVLTLCSLKGMIPLKQKYRNTFFFKLTFEQSFFIPLKAVVVALRVRCGHIFYRKLSSIMPSERFYLGGSHSLRGYEMDLAPPLGVFVDQETNEHIVPRGGKSMLNINAELRFPIYKKIGGVLFQDFGILSGDTFDDFKPQNFLGSTGFGGRFFTPLGPLRFDIGWKWRKQIPAERSFAWFLSFGQAF